MPADGVPDWRVRRVSHQLSENNGNPALKLSRLSQQLSLTPRHLSRQFKKTLGVSFRTYAGHARMTKALELLMKSASSVKEIAATLGYSHASDLNHRFKKEYGISPRHFRQRVSHLLRGAGIGNSP